MNEPSDRERPTSTIRECDKHSPHFYMPDEYVRAIERGDYRRAYNLIVNDGIST
jgi:hypothetical protein